MEKNRGGGHSFTYETAMLIRADYAQGLTPAQLGIKYGTSQGTISKILNNKIYIDNNYVKPDRPRDWSHNSKAKLTDEQADHIRMMAKSGISITSIATAYGINKATVQRIVTNKIHKT